MNNMPKENEFVMRILMEKDCSMPSKSHFINVLEKHFGSVGCFSHNVESASFDVHSYSSTFDNVDVSPQIMVSKCVSNNGWSVDKTFLAQMCETKDIDTILDRCKFQVVASDMLAEGMPYKDRAEMLMKFLDALLELYPECKAVYFENSGKLLSRRKIQRTAVSDSDKFIYFAVNIRHFNIKESAEEIVDTVGMSTLSLPDLEYHFKEIPSELIIEHAYNVLSVIFENGDIISDGDTIEGFKDGEISDEVLWVCNHDNSKIQPSRKIVEIKA